MATAKKNAAINRIPSRPLPPDPEGKNDERSEWAQAAIDAFCAETACEEEHALGDLVGALAHWPDRHNYDLGAAILRARTEYRADTSGRGPQFEELEAL